MVFKNLIGMEIRFRYNSNSYDGIIINAYMVKHGQYRTDVEKLLILLDNNKLSLMFISNITNVRFTNNEQIELLKQKLSNIDEEDEDDLSREQLIDLED